MQLNKSNPFPENANSIHSDISKLKSDIENATASFSVKEGRKFAVGGKNISMSEIIAKVQNLSKTLKQTPIKETSSELEAHHKSLKQLSAIANKIKELDANSKTKLKKNNTRIIFFMRRFLGIPSFVNKFRMSKLEKKSKSALTSFKKELRTIAEKFRTDMHILDSKKRGITDATTLINESIKDIKDTIEYHQDKIQTSSPSDSPQAKGFASSADLDRKAKSLLDLIDNDQISEDQLRAEMAPKVDTLYATIEEIHEKYAANIQTKSQAELKQSINELKNLLQELKQVRTNLVDRKEIIENKIEEINQKHEETDEYAENVRGEEWQEFYNQFGARFGFYFQFFQAVDEEVPPPSQSQNFAGLSLEKFNQDFREYETQLEAYPKKLQDLYQDLKKIYTSRFPETEKIVKKFFNLPDSYTKAQLDSAVRKKMMLCHPDKQNGDVKNIKFAGEIFNAIENVKIFALQRTG